MANYPSPKSILTLASHPKSTLTLTSHLEQNVGLGKGKWAVSQKRIITPRVSPSRAPVLSFAHYFQAPATQANNIGRGRVRKIDVDNCLLVM